MYVGFVVEHVSNTLAVDLPLDENESTLVGQLKVVDEVLKLLLRAQNLDLLLNGIVYGALRLANY